MSRGWESKSVEEQQAEAGRPKVARERLSAEEASRRRERESLVLSRNGVVEQIRVTRNARRREMLEMALADLDLRIAGLG
jgi:hypothetical protein